MNDTIEYLPEDTCPSCHEGTLEEGSRDFTSQTQDGRQVLIKNLVARTCNKCGESIFPRESLDQIEAAVVRALGSLSPEQVEEFVDMTGLREDELCERLGLGGKTIYRWRRGAQRPSQSLSILLAMVAHHPHLLGWVQSGEWRKSKAEPVRYFPTLDSHWEQLRVRFPHSQGRESSLSTQDEEKPRSSRFNPAIGLCAAEVE